MNLFRITFLTLATLALVGTTYVSWYGYGGEDTDISRSIRDGSRGAGALAGRVK